jgi:2-dehydro-3-deoxygalactonokinase
VSQQYILGDWGTTRLRLYRLDGARVIDQRAGTGIAGLKVAPAVELAALTEPWIGALRSIDVVLCGMASSRRGLRELPYAQAPASFAAWAEAADYMTVGSLRVLLATGLQCGDDAAGYDVMRGEEAQIFGAMRLEPALAQGSHCFVLPGTHSKWVETGQGRIQNFRTALTGEMYALLRAHSTLLLPSDEAESDVEFERGFAVGQERYLHGDESLLAALFKVRTAQLLQARSRGWAAGLLSGLLIGYEIASMKTVTTPARMMTLIGESRLTSLYQRVFATHGMETKILDGTACALAALRQLRDHRADVAARAS